MLVAIDKTFRGALICRASVHVSHRVGLLQHGRFLNSNLREASRSHCSTESTHREMKERGGDRWIILPILAGEGLSDDGDNVLHLGRVDVISLLKSGLSPEEVQLLV